VPKKNSLNTLDFGVKSYRRVAETTVVICHSERSEESVCGCDSLHQENEILRRIAPQNDSFSDAFKQETVWEHLGKT
jgi:hypothetical protein